MRRERVQGVSMEVLELVERDHMAVADELRDHCRQARERRRYGVGRGIDLEGLECVGEDRQHARRFRVGNLAVDEPSLTGADERSLDERRLPDPSPAADLDERESTPFEDRLQRRLLSATSVEAPLHPRLATSWPLC